MKMKLFLYSVVVLCFLAQNAVGTPAFGIWDIFNSSKTIIEGIGGEIINRIPTPNELFHVSKQVLFGLPETAVFQTIGQLCFLYMAAETIQPRITPDIEAMSLKLRTPCKNLSFPLKQAEKLLESPEFDVNKKVVLLVTGWMSSPEADYVYDMARAFHCRGNYNFVVLDSSDFIDTLFTWSAYNTEAVGRIVSVGLEKLVQVVPVENIHLIGHSLGSHIVGYAARYLTEKTGLTIPRITGLDPANPCFYEGNKLSGLQRGDALVVDVIHSNPGALGKADSVGDIDFYPQGKETIKPGCVKFPCSHGRAYEYFIESVYPGNENNFMGVRCTSLKDVSRDYCKGAQAPMGYAAPLHLKGNFYMSVNGDKPFGKNSNNRASVPANCGKCQQSL